MDKESKKAFLSEEALLAELKKGQEQAYKNLFYTYFADLVLYAHSILKDRAAAEDVVQEIFITFWQEQKYKRIDSGLEGYLYRSAHNFCLNYLRNEKRKNDRLVETMVDAADQIRFSFDDIEVEQEREEIYRAYHQLPAQCREIFTLCCLEGLKYQEAADQLGVSINTVRTQMGRAFKYLRESLSGKTFSSILVFILGKVMAR